MCKFSVQGSLGRINLRFCPYKKVLMCSSKQLYPLYVHILYNLQYKHVQRGHKDQTDFIACAGLHWHVHCSLIYRIKAYSGLQAYSQGGIRLKVTFQLVLGCTGMSRGMRRRKSSVPPAALLPSLPAAGENMFRKSRKRQVSIFAWDFEHLSCKVI